MLHLFRSIFHRQDTMTFVGRCSLVVTGALLVLLIWSTWSHNLFEAYGMAPHGYCFLWNSQLVTLHVVSDSLIGLSYVCISSTLLYLVSSIYRDLPFRWIFISFGGFIIACGATHFLDVWTLWYATYWLSGTVKLITAIASVSTAIILPPLVPKVRELIAQVKISEERKKQLERTHQELEVLYQQAQQLNEFKTQFFARVSHELRTPLTLILSSASILQKEYPRSVDIEAVQRNTFTLIKRVNDLLDMAKFEAGQVSLRYSRVDLVEVLHECLQHFILEAHRREIQLTMETPSKLIAEIDSENILRVFFNLIANAMRFTPVGGSIVCTLQEEDSSLTFSIQDTGPGISPDIRQTLFEPFIQAKDHTNLVGSSGLGLAIVKELVILHQATITVSDCPGGGACFTIILPVFAPEGVSVVDERVHRENISAEFSRWYNELEYQSVSLPADDISQEQLSTRPSILIIEDHREMSSFLVRLLASQYQIRTAFDGVEGLEKALVMSPDLILCDVLMPGMSGEQFIKALRADPKVNTIPVIMLSAHMDARLRIQLLREGAQDYLLKPFLPEELHARVTNLLMMQQTRQILQQELASQGQDIVSLTNELVIGKHELESTNEQLRQMGQLQQDFIAMVSHEFRTTLTSIQGFSELLHTEEFSSQEVKDFAQSIYMDAKRLVRMISDLLDLERMRSGQQLLRRDPINFNALLTQVVTRGRLALLSQHTIRLQLDESLPPILGDEDKLTQLVLNLLSNAVKYSPDGGEILVSNTRQGEAAHFYVQDHGIGIASEDIPKLFTAYSRINADKTRYIKGTGLGLAIIQQISELHGGRVWVESTEGLGSTFHVLLPLADPLLTTAISYTRS